MGIINFLLKNLKKRVISTEKDPLVFEVAGAGKILISKEFGWRCGNIRNGHRLEIDWYKGYEGKFIGGVISHKDLVKLAEFVLKS